MIKIGKLKYLWYCLTHCVKNANASSSARFILEDVGEHELSSVTKLPVGVISAAYDNIFYN